MLCSFIYTNPTLTLLLTLPLHISLLNLDNSLTYTLATLTLAHTCTLTGTIARSSRSPR